MCFNAVLEQWDAGRPHIQCNFYGLVNCSYCPEKFSGVARVGGAQGRSIHIEKVLACFKKVLNPILAILILSAYLPSAPLAVPLEEFVTIYGRQYSTGSLDVLTFHISYSITTLGKRALRFVGFKTYLFSIA